MWGNDMSSDFARIILCTLPEARAVAMGDKDYSSLYGVVSFYPAGKGTLITAEVNGLPQTQTNIYAMHIHQGSSCTGNEQDPFADTGGHYNPGNLPHPEHLGDLPPLFGRGICVLFVLHRKIQALRCNREDSSNPPSAR